MNKNMLCKQQVERPLRLDIAKKIMTAENITLSRYKKIYNPEIEFYNCGYRAKFKVTHHINIRAEERIDYVCALHKNQLVCLSKKADLPIIVEKID